MPRVRISPSPPVFQSLNGLAIRSAIRLARQCVQGKPCHLAVRLSHLIGHAVPVHVRRGTDVRGLHFFRLNVLPALGLAGQLASDLDGDEPNVAVFQRGLCSFRGAVRGFGDGGRLVHRTGSEHGEQFV